MNKITVTYGEIMRVGAWDKFCKVYGINEWCMSEGLADHDTTEQIYFFEAVEWGIFESLIR
jgi:hypothetical protein